MSSQPVRVSLSGDQVEAVARITDDLPGFVSEAVAFQLRRHAVAENLRAYEREHGSFTAEELAEAWRSLVPTVSEAVAA